MTHFEKLRFWCQKVLPLAYDDSLSYYELLCKVVEHLNTLGSGFEELLKAFEELKEAVEDPDVQQYVDAKIDEMYASGELATLFNRWFTRSYDTITDMQADESLEAGMFVTTAGRENKQDGFGWSYTIDDTGFIPLVNGLYATPLLQPTMNIGTCIYPGNDVDITEMLRALLNSGSVTTLEIPNGDFEISDVILVEGLTDITVKNSGSISCTIRPRTMEIDGNVVDVCTALLFKQCNSVHITGGSWSFACTNSVTMPITSLHYYNMVMALKCGSLEVSDLNCDGAVNGYFFSADDTLAVNAHDNRLENGDVGGFIVWNRCQSAHFARIQLFNFRHDYGVEPDVTRYCYPIGSGVTRLTREAGDDMPLIETFVIDSCTVDGCGWEGFDTHNSRNTVIRNSSAHNCYRFLGCYHESNYFPDNNGGQLLVENCRFENDDDVTLSTMFYINDDIGFRYDTITFRDCTIIGMNTGTAYTRMNTVTFENCDFDFRGSNTIAIAHRNGDVHYINCTAKNGARQNGMIVTYGATVLEIRGCEYVYETDSSANVYALFQASNLTLIRYDHTGTVNYQSGSANQLVQTGASVDGCVEGGALRWSTNNAAPLGFYDCRTIGLGSHGAGIFASQAGSYTNLASVDVVSGRNYITSNMTSAGAAALAFMPGQIVAVTIGAGDAEVMMVTGVQLKPVSNGVAQYAVFFSDDFSATGTASFDLQVALYKTFTVT